MSSKKKSIKIMLGLLAVLILIGGYGLLSYLQHQKNPSDTTIPNLSQLGEGVQTIFKPNHRNGDIWILEDSKASLIRLAGGLGLSVLISLILGLLMGSFPFLEAFLLPPLRLFAKMTPTAMLAVFFVMVGTGMKMYITMIVFGITPTLTQSIFLAVKDVPLENLYKASTLGASRPEIIINVVLGQILPKAIDSIRLQIGPAMVFLIAAEMVVGDIGFGYRIRLQSRLLNMNVVYPYIIILAGFGFGMDTLLKSITKWICPWYQTSNK